MNGDAIPVAVIGSAASAILRAHARGRVLAAFRRSFYVGFDRDVICLGSLELGFGPLNVLCARRDDRGWIDVGVETEATVIRSKPMLDVGGRLRFDFAGAKVCMTPAAPALPGAAFRPGLQLLKLSARRRAPGGLGAFVHASNGRDDPLLHAALPSIAALRRWLRAALGGSTAPPPAMDALIGLGPGLTPSGDDFLGGAMIALHHLGRGHVARRLAEVVQPAAAHATNVMSAAYLRCAADGQGMKVLFDVLECIAAADGPLLEQRLDAIDAVGHTSGWDCLAGAAMVCELVQDTLRRTSSASSAACAFDGATTIPASSSKAT